MPAAFLVNLTPQLFAWAWSIQPLTCSGILCRLKDFLLILLLLLSNHMSVFVCVIWSDELQVVNMDGLFPITFTGEKDRREGIEMEICTVEKEMSPS